MAKRFWMRKGFKDSVSCHKGLSSINIDTTYNCPMQDSLHCGTSQRNFHFLPTNLPFCVFCYKFHFLQANLPFCVFCYKFHFLQTNLPFFVFCYKFLTAAVPREQTNVEDNKMASIVSVGQGLQTRSCRTGY